MKRTIDMAPTSSFQSYIVEYESSILSLSSPANRGSTTKLLLRNLEKNTFYTALWAKILSSAVSLLRYLTYSRGRNWCR